MIDQMLWQQTVLMWARWWIEHPVQYRVFKVFDLLRTGILCLTVVCFMIPTIPTFMLGAAGLLFWAIHALCFRVYAGVFVKPAFMSYLLRGRSLEDFHTTGDLQGPAYSQVRQGWVASPGASVPDAGPIGKFPRVKPGT